MECPWCGKQCLLDDDYCSKCGHPLRPASTPVTGSSLDELLSDLGLEHHLKNKLTLSEVLEIDGEIITDENIESLKSLPWCFLRKLMMMNVTARSVRCSSQEDRSALTVDAILDDLDIAEGHSNTVNPLDLITAVLLCSDGFLQQEIVLKMSMCQFSVPLLLPKCDTQQCTLMLWAMRDIVKKYQPHYIEDQRGFLEESIVLSQLPMISFVRLGNCSMSKSHILNRVLSNSQQYHDTFVHRNMENGDTQRRISNGLVEISWYLPSGNRDIDIFSEPLAIANLRGDLSDFETQYSFLCNSSSAIFVFCDDFRTKCKVLDRQQCRAKLFLISNSESKIFNKAEFRQKVSGWKVERSNIVLKDPLKNDAKLIEDLRSAINNILKGILVKKSVERMSAVAHELGIQVDEDYTYCQTGKQRANEITEKIFDITRFKEKELPLQGMVWKRLAKLEKEECRLKNAGGKNIEVYRNELADQRKQLRAQQRAYKMSESMSLFIKAMSASIEERKYFIKWMRINLNNKSHKDLLVFRSMYKDLCKDSGKNKEQQDLDRKISSYSMGTEHFLREMAQLYESACSDPKGPSPEIQGLPRLCAELLQEGFPLELVDGDASNIPLQWVTQVLRELDHLTPHKCKIRVITALGVQSTGKSTLLNTMFGVQFAVSSGRCTRGAFMILIRVKENFTEQLGCDYIMVIDTEGLKSAELAQLDESYEHDNELATLVVGLSDITIINIAMQNSAEMKDILQIVVHAFLRMKEVGRKPCCQFVHQNVPDVSAHNNTMKDRKNVLEQLNEMTQAAAKMEKHGNNTIFTDVMEYDPERNTWYIHGLWHGIPPMAPVNVGYSDHVYKLTRSMIEMFQEQKNGKSAAHTFEEFIEWTRSLWKAVKDENFIFSFRNSIVAEAYTQLCMEFNKWEWDFRKNMYFWLSQAETRVLNFGMLGPQNEPSVNVDMLLGMLKGEVSLDLDKEQEIILENLAEFYKRPNGHVNLVEKYKEEFNSAAKTIRREIEYSVKSKLETAVEIRKGMYRLESIKKNHSATMEDKVLDLIEKCRENENMSDQRLETEFEKMWNDNLTKLRITRQEPRDIEQEIHHQLRVDLQTESGAVREMLSKVGNLSKCGKGPLEVWSKDQGKFKMALMPLCEGDPKVRTQEIVDRIITCSRQFVDEKVRTRSDYHSTYITELLHRISENLDNLKDLEISAEFKAELKIHICGYAAREFRKMHLDFIRANDPRHCLEQFKEQYCADFKDMFNKRDQCQKKAEEFTYNCLQPAVREYIDKSLGPDLLYKVMIEKKGIDFGTRSFFQFSILKQLISDDNFQEFESYINNYEVFLQEWILKQMVEQFSKGDELGNIEIKYLKEMVKRLKGSIESAQMKVSKQATGKAEEDQNIQQFIQDICSDLDDVLVIPKDPLRAVLALNKAKPRDFSECLTKLVDEMEQNLMAEFQRGGDMRALLTSLPFQPQKELFDRMFGCGKQCPFCEAPCEAGGKNHTMHFASIHRPKGIGRVRNVRSHKLSISICTSSVARRARFRVSETGDKWNKYREYQSIFPDWLIQLDPTIEASDYWKYVLTRFNDQFAKIYQCEPADIPVKWKNISKYQAIESLKESFQIKARA